MYIDHDAEQFKNKWLQKIVHHWLFDTEPETHMQHQFEFEKKTERWLSPGPCRWLTSLPNVSVTQRIRSLLFPPQKKKPAEKVECLWVNPQVVKHSGDERSPALSWLTSKCSFKDSSMNSAAATKGENGADLTFSKAGWHKGDSKYSTLTKSVRRVMTEFRD